MTVTLTRDDAIIWTIIIVALCFFMFYYAFRWRLATKAEPRELYDTERHLVLYSYAIPIVIFLLLVKTWSSHS